MSAPYAEFVPEATSLYESERLIVNIGVSTAGLVLYDTILTLDKEVLYVWRAHRRWHQQLLYVLCRHAVLVFLVLCLGTINPISNKSCSAIVYTMGVAAFLGSLGPGVFTIWRAYALSGKNKLIGGAMLIMGLGTMIYNAVVELYNTPINLPPPENCSIERNLSESWKMLLNILGAACPVVGLTLVTVVTWRKTRGTGLRSELGEFSHRRPSLPQILFEYGMVYFCVILVLDLAGTVLDLLSLSLPGSGDYGSYPTYFIPSLMSILTSRLLLDMYETEARLQRGGASNTGSFSLNLGSNGRPGSVSMPDFITSYGGPARSFPDEGDANAGAEPIDTEEYNEGALSTASDWPNAEATTASGSGSEFGQGGITLHPGGETGGEAPQRIRPTGEMLA